MSKKGSIGDKLSRLRYRQRRTTRNEIEADLSDIRLDLTAPGMHLKTSGALERTIIEPPPIKVKKKGKPPQQPGWVNYPEQDEEGRYISSPLAAPAEPRWQDKIERDTIRSDVPLDRIFRR